ncbi:MAG: MAPEG family protein [Hoeflea sp.]|uniref:MAPEG family protein n=1 Tax=Hoeflea sp. TaxID=1940281 RepID=UPI001D53D6BF|nr:MAPEG family protein [Hoeflea sp.]MBU4529164.1 MAPEG family protein [Alphaproteobacteria bacterium]MBU4543569.1 MAPEG family protein [Alphaproteobacteria bacterium]MBU4549194.1 MAPEG family protein [Alphaproteobacteria bacterium]MBV1725329.1 MAPEG family protein [Hoeflea sp.]MBV1785290.1 MAPEG family protein [Hoeflea sp.]
MTPSTAIFWPVLAQVLLTYGIYMVVSARRLGAVKAGTAKVSDFKVPSIEPEPSATAARNLVNQFELPVLFYAACLSLYVTGGAGGAAVVVAWAFVLARAVHAYVHVTSNRVRLRRRLFIASLAVNFAQWLLLAIHIV